MKVFVPFIEWHYSESYTRATDLGAYSTIDKAIEAIKRFVDISDIRKGSIVFMATHEHELDGIVCTTRPLKLEDVFNDTDIPVS